METIVTQMASTRTGKAVANQFIISTPEGIFFQSYNTIVAKKERRQNLFRPVFLELLKNNNEVP